MADAHQNFGYGTVATAPSPATSGTSLTLTAGDELLNATPPFNATVWPKNKQPLKSNAEIVRVTAINTITRVITIAGTEEGTSTRGIVAANQIADTATAKKLTDIEAAVL